jgi:23S rRNA (guanine2445-N2)-methyltransferase / 23S rRNA (guanine2069-N7)-methyltransferase
VRTGVFVTAATGTADLLAAELVSLGVAGVREAPGGASCEASLAEAYRVCLWSRLGLRVLWRLDDFPVSTADDLYTGLRRTDWSTHMAVGGTLAVDFAGAVPGISHSQFGAQRSKDAIVDQFRERTGERPSVDRQSPDLRVNVHAARSRGTVALQELGHALGDHLVVGRGPAATAADEIALVIGLDASPLRGTGDQREGEERDESGQESHHRSGVG